MKNEIVVKKQVTMIASWDHVRIYLNKLHPKMKLT